MNTKLFLLAGAFSTLFLFSSCQKDDSKDGPGSTNNGSFSFKMDGTLWEPKSITSARLVKAEVTPGIYTKSLLILLEGKDGSTANFTITDMDQSVPDGCVGLGTYYGLGSVTEENSTHVGNIYSGGGLIITEGNGNMLSAMIGSLEVESCGGNKVSGSFEFMALDFSTGEENVPFTEGKFEDIEFTEQ
jgi:hypothetical protein